MPPSAPDPDRPHRNAVGKRIKNNPRMTYRRLTQRVDLQHSAPIQESMVPVKIALTVRSRGFTHDLDSRLGANPRVRLGPAADEYDSPADDRARAPEPYPAGGGRRPRPIRYVR